MANGLNIVLVGPPGAGKSTQARAITQKYGLVQLSTGDMVRDAISKGGKTGHALQQAVSKGEMAPEHLILELITARLSQPDCQSGFILDGFPRNHAQADMLQTLLRSQGRSLDTVIEIDVSDKNVIKRICGRFSCSDCDTVYHKDFKQPQKTNECDDCHAVDSFVRRSDDTEKVVTRRLAIYKSRTRSILPYYQAKGLLKTVDGNETPHNIQQQIFKILDEKLADKAVLVVKKNRHPNRRHKNTPK